MREYRKYKNGKFHRSSLKKLIKGDIVTVYENGKLQKTKEGYSLFMVNKNDGEKFELIYLEGVEA